ncbi:MAG: DUF58 domain-containing protein, partial [Bacteroidia bacterium]|nr:DUF58 domain-containing protein [Bacteroidia bacterium]
MIKRDLIEPFSKLELLAKQVVEGFITGLHKSPFHGFSVEFAEHRIYNPGESTRHIDWKLYAKTDKLFLKRYEEETNLRCQLMIDISNSMLFPLEAEKENKFNKLSFSVYAAAAIMQLLKNQRDAFGLTLFDNEVSKHYPAKSNPTQQKIIYHDLEALLQKPEQQSTQDTQSAKALNQIAEIIHQRSLVIIFSDLFEDSSHLESIFSALQHLKYKKHDVVLFHVTDKKMELDFEFENRPYHFIDIETKEELKLNPNQVKEFYTTK